MNYSHALADKGGFLEVLMVVNLHLSVGGGALVLHGFLVVGIGEFKLSLGAGIRRVHNEEELGLVSAVLGFVFEVIDGESWLVSRHLSLEVIESGISGTNGLNLDFGETIVGLEDKESSLSSFNVGEFGRDGVLDGESHI
eukprot:CAMPEP_0116870140 /NCGR_PEP_ID=MMETSP0463-20121206/5_1 /TAXON_ID=181622 /ORGANISM="Strombidinopsis sp, Strain SopsisLIS2011" /LENGTH=139 /DNA_ID=CAMNT_0004506293 /DNA_START=195 /DNA_END=614 /DNA_ORIENTATION=+